MYFVWWVLLYLRRGALHEYNWSHTYVIIFDFLLLASGMLHLVLHHGCVGGSCGDLRSRRCTCYGGDVECVCKCI